MEEADEERLRALTQLINTAEHEGRWPQLHGVLARRSTATEQDRAGGEEPLLAFRRASAACVDARSFLDGVKADKEGVERSVEITSIEGVGRFRAIVRCVVTLDGKRYDNLRVFVRAELGSQDWRLLAWANEAL